MRIIFCGLKEEVLTVSLVVLGRRSLGGERRLDTLGMSHRQCAIHLVGRDMVEALAIVLLGQRLPIELGGLQQ